ncbi:MAG: ABC transporter ATP-binding protein, partial [Erysipelothrix sp.]|nr:ABC transporter ATP-binding protein [Erysipelothrix sp.]
IGAGYSLVLRDKLVKKVSHFSLKEMSDFSTPSLINRSTNDIMQVQMLVIMMLRMLITAPITAYNAIVKIQSLNGTLTLAVVVAVVVIVVGIGLAFVFVIPRFKLIQELIDALNLVARENLTGLRVVRAFNAQNYQESKFEDVNEKLLKNNLFVNRVMSLIMPVMFFVMNTLSLAIVWISAILINNQNLGANPLEGMSIQIQFLTYGVMIVTSFMILSMMFIMVPRAEVSAKRINEVLETEVSIVSGPQTLTIDEQSDVELAFNQVDFRYPHADENVLSDISFTAKEGEIVAFIGSTGSGKSTLINLVTRFFDVSSGSITINQQDIRDLSLESLYDLIGYVPQKGVLFSGTIRSNLQLGNPGASDSEMKEALDIAQASEFVDKLELGLDSPITQDATNVSGGQKQRLSIARAIVKKPKIFIFDDSFSALDFQTDKKLRSALSKVTKQSITFIVAQRVGTILNADKIIVLDKGHVVGYGTHHELLKTSSVYQEIASSQLSVEELEYGKA